MTSIDLPERPRILVVTLRRLGDVLLTTPLVRTIRRGFPQGTLDILVFRGSERILKGNPDVDNVITVPERPSAGETLALVRQLWRRYDLAVTTQAGDRPTFYAVVAGRRRVGLIPHAGQTGAWWKRHAHHIAVAGRAGPATGSPSF
jgi:heptosyltransferase-3